MDTTLTVLTMPGLVLPPRNVAREHWSTSEQMAVPLLHLASWYASRAIYGREMHERKLVALDEIHFLGEWGAGRALFTRLGRDSRKWNTCVLAASQNPEGRPRHGRRELHGRRVRRAGSRTRRTPPTACACSGCPRASGTSACCRCSRRAAGPRAGTERVASREFVLRDVDGRVDKMRVDLTHNPGLLAVLDTTAKPAAQPFGARPEEFSSVNVNVDVPVDPRSLLPVAGDDEIAFV